MRVRACVRETARQFFLHTTHNRTCTLPSCATSPHSLTQTLGRSCFQAAIKSPPLRAVPGRRTSAPAPVCGGGRTHAATCQTGLAGPHRDEPVLSAATRRWPCLLGRHKRLIKVSIVCLSFPLHSESTKGIIGRTYLSTFQASLWCQRAGLHLKRSTAADCQTLVCNFSFHVRVN